MMHPELVKRMYEEGHEIGSHTFTHPNVASITPFQTKMELNANQRLFQEITGHSMTLFRPPLCGRCRTEHNESNCCLYYKHRIWVIPWSVN